MGLKYIREISSVGYKIENNNDDDKCEIKDRNCRRIRRYLIINLKKYNI